MIVLLLVEVLMFSLRLDTAKLFSTEQPWWTAVGVYWIARPIVVAIIATLLIGGARLREQIRQRDDTKARSRETGLVFLAHIGSFVALVWFADVAQSWLVDISQKPSLHQDLPHIASTLVVLVGMVLVTLGLWAAVAVPMRLFGPRARRGAATLLLMSVAAGVAASETSLLFLDAFRSTWWPEGGVVKIAVAAVSVLGTLGLWAAAAVPVRLFGPRARGSTAALLFVSIAAGIAGSVVNILATYMWFDRHLATPLTTTTLWPVYALLHLVCAHPVCQPSSYSVGTPTFTVSIGAACSGIEGMTLIVVFLGAHLAAFRSHYRFPQALLLLPLGLALMWMVNVMRIVLLVAIGTWVSSTVAVGGFHTNAGWLAFSLVGLSLVISSRRLRYFAAADRATDPAPAAFTNPTAAYLDPLLAIIATTMITGAFTSGFDQFYPLRVLAAAAALLYFRHSYSELKWTWSWTGVGIGVVTFVLWMSLEPAPSGSGETSLASGLASLPPCWATTWLVFRVVGSVVTAPLAEELAFRGYLTRRLIAAEFQEVPLGQFTWFSFLVSSVLFGALHGRWLAGILAGMMYAFALYRRGELSDAVVAHGTTNALIAAYVLATGSWWLW